MKRSCCETDHSPLSTAEFKNGCSYIYTSPVRLRGMQSNCFIFSFTYRNCLPDGVLICVKFLSSYSSFSLTLAITVSVITPMIQLSLVVCTNESTSAATQATSEFSVTRSEIRGELSLEDRVSWVKAEPGCFDCCCIQINP